MHSHILTHTHPRTLSFNVPCGDGSQTSRNPSVLVSPRSLWVPLSLPSSLQVSQSYCSGTYRAGPMRQISLVGAVDEEVGDYFPEFLDMLEESPFLKVCPNSPCRVVRSAAL